MSSLSLSKLCLASSVLAAVSAAQTSSWMSQALPSKDAVNQIMLPAQGPWWLSTHQSFILRTDDGGNHWSRLDVRIPNTKIDVLWFTSPSKGWAIGMSYRGGHSFPQILHTDDGASSWQVQHEMACSMAGQLADVWFGDTQTGWVVGTCASEAVILSTRDGGVTWEEKYRSGDLTPELVAIRFADPQNGWAVGGSALLSTKDGGLHWSSQAGGRDTSVFTTLFAVSRNQVWVGGVGSQLLRTTDGGQTWEGVHLPGDPAWLTQIVFDGPDRGWVAGARGEIYSTADSGATWKLEQVQVDVLRDLAVSKDALIAIVESPPRILIRRR